MGREELAKVRRPSSDSSDGGAKSAGDSLVRWTRAAAGDASEAPWVRELLANNGRARCHLQLLPSTQAPLEVDLFIPLLQVRHERQSGPCVYCDGVRNSTPEEDSLRESKSCCTSDAGPKWAQILGSAATSGLIHSAGICLDELRPRRLLSKDAEWNPVKPAPAAALAAKRSGGAFRCNRQRESAPSHCSTVVPGQTPSSCLCSVTLLVPFFSFLFSSRLLSLI